MNLIFTSGPPSAALGSRGDFALDPVAKTFYGPKGPTDWPTDAVAVKTMIDTAVAEAVVGLLDFKGAIDASTNPSYPAATKGDSYIVSVAGKVGGGSGKDVGIGDFVIAIADATSGVEAGVGGSWIAIEHNLPALGTAATKNVGTSSGDVAAGNAPAAVQAAAMGVVINGSNPSVARPSGWGGITWIGTAQPAAMSDNDIWYNPNP